MTLEKQRDLPYPLAPTLRSDGESNQSNSPLHQSGEGPGVRRNHLILAALTGLLLLVAASRIVRLGAMEMNWDEVWSVWQTFGSPQEVLRWTPFDWPPLYFLTLAGWKALVGFFPFVLRYLSASAFLIGSACTYRAVRRIWG